MPTRAKKPRVKKRASHTKRSGGQLVVENLYESAAVKPFTTEEFHYGAEKQTLMSLPARMLWLASSGSGKTNCAMNMFFKHMRCFERCYVVACDIDEALYRGLQDRPEDWSNPDSPTAMEVVSTDEPADFDAYWHEMEAEIKENDNARFVQKLAIFDDLLGETLPRSMIKSFNRGRKLGLSTCFINSSYAQTSKPIRNNCSYVCLLSLDVLDDAVRILRAYSLPKSVIDWYLDIIKTPGQWLMIDNTPRGKKDPNLRLRHNYQPIGTKAVVLKHGPHQRKPTVEEDEKD